MGNVIKQRQAEMYIGYDVYDEERRRTFTLEIRHLWDIGHFGVLPGCKIIARNLEDMTEIEQLAFAIRCYSYDKEVYYLPLHIFSGEQITWCRENKFYIPGTLPEGTYLFRKPDGTVIDPKTKTPVIL